MFYFDFWYFEMGALAAKGGGMIYPIDLNLTRYATKPLWGGVVFSPNTKAKRSFSPYI
ncbi:MAG: hypothetical protein LBI06_05450 [Treponema sp.]|jgi:hypothetical protein|nr:hypothetical protein [Treponema sp.]